MKIAILNTLNPRTGMGKYSFSLLKQLNSLDADATMFYMNYFNKTFSYNKIKTIDSIKIPFLRQTLNDFYYFPKKLPKDYDIYHLTSQGIAVFLKYIQRPKIITVFDLIPYTLPKNIPPVLNYFAKKSISCLSYADKIIASSLHTKKDIINFLNLPEDKIEVIPAAINKKTFYPRKKEESRLNFKLSLKQKVLLHVGNDEPRKNVSLIIKAVYEIKKEFLDILLIRVGNASKQTLNLIKKLGLGKNIIFFSDLSEEKLAELYSAADLFIFPSSYEGFGLPPLEAIACGCPVISSKLTSLSEVLGNAACYLDNLDELELKEKTINILNNKKTSNNLINLGFEQIKKFDLKETAIKTLNLYNQILDK